MALDEVTATALNSDARNWMEVAGRGFSSVRPVLDEPPYVRHQGSQKGTALHHTSHISGTSEFLPKFLPKQAARRSRDVISPGHGHRSQ